MINLNLTAASRVGLNLLVLLGVVVALRLGMSVFIPTVMAVLLAAILWPAATWMHRRLRFPWVMACTVAVGGLVVLNLLLTLGFLAAIPRMLHELPDPRDIAEQHRLYRNFRAQLIQLSPVPLNGEYLPEDAEQSRVFQYVRETLQGPYVTNALLDLAKYVNSWAWQCLLILFILFFLLLEGRMLSRRLAEIFGPGPEAQAKAVAALADMAGQVRVFLVWRTIINFGVGVLVGLIYHYLGLRQAWTWALLTAVLFYIPYLGPLVAGIPPVLDALLHCPSPWYVLAVILLYIAVLIVEGYFVVPVVMGRSMELNATTVMLACLFWDLVWGTPGLFLAMPLMAALKAVCHHVPGWQPWANLMGTAEVEQETVEAAAARQEKALEDTQLLPPEEVLAPPRTPSSATRS